VVVEVQMQDADPVGVRASGEVRVRGRQEVVQAGIATRMTFADRFDVPPGRYTYVFAIDRKATFKLVAVDGQGTALGAARSYAPTSVAAELRYHFEVE
jgi:hypothetical protein